MWYKAITLVEYLLDKGAEIDALSETSEGWRSLHIAIWNNSLDIVQLLLKKGASANPLNDNEKPPLSLAGSGILSLDYDFKVAECLLENGADINIDGGRIPTPIASMMYTSNEFSTNQFKKFLDKGLNINIKDIGGNTLLHAAVRKRSVNFIKFLIQNGADIKAVNHQGETLLHEAAKGSTLDVVRFLIDAGLDIRAKNNEGDTPIDLLQEYSLKDMDGSFHFGF